MGEWRRLLTVSVAVEAAVGLERTVELVRRQSGRNSGS